MPKSQCCGRLVTASLELTSGFEQATHEMNELLDANRNAQQEYQEAIGGIDSEAKSAIGLVEQLRELSGQTVKTAKDQDMIAEICQRLNSMIPELSLSYDKESDSIDGLTGSLDDYIEKLYQAERDKERIKRLVDLKGSIHDTEEAKSQVDELLKLRDQLAGEGSDTFTTEQSLAVWRATLGQLTEQLQSQQAEYNELTGQVQNYTDAQSDAAAGTNDLIGAISSVEGEVARLAKDYADAYAAARDSISGQYQIWDEAAEVVEVSAGSINSAMESQIKYWNDYNADLQKLNDRAADIEGLRGVISQFADGSTESVNAIRGMANASDEELKKMVSCQQELQKSHDETAQSLSNLTTGLDQETSKMVALVQQKAKEMNFAPEAKIAAEQSLNAFIQEANDKLPAVRAAYQAVADAARAALQSVPSISVPSSSGKSSGSSGKSSTGSGYRGRDSYGFAAGTNYAPPGWAWVGEEGPELMHMRGGETVLPAEISKEFALLSAYQSAVSDHSIYNSSDHSVTNQVSEIVQYDRQNAANYQPFIEQNHPILPHSVDVPVIPTVQIPEDGIVSNALFRELKAFSKQENEIAAYADGVGSFQLPAMPAITVNAPVQTAPMPAMTTLTALPMSSNSGSGQPVSIEMHIHIEAGAPPEAVQSFQDYIESRAFEERILEVTEEAKINAERMRL